MDADGPSTNVEAYARLRAQLSSEGADRDALLARHGLDEESWDALDDRYQAELSEALEGADDELPLLVQRYAEAFAEAQRLGPGQEMSLEQFAACARAVERARDPRLALSKLGTNLTAFLKANHRWSPQLATDPELARRFRAALAAARPQVLGPDDPLHEGWVEPEEQDPTKKD